MRWTDPSCVMFSVLARAAGESIDVVELYPADCRRRAIDLLESLGFLEAREGDVGKGEDPDEFYIIGITSTGRLKLSELRRSFRLRRGV